MGLDGIKAGEGDVIISAGVEMVSGFALGSSDGLPNTKNPLFADAEARTKTFSEGGKTWHDPRKDGAIPDVYIAMGETAEKVAQQRGISRQAQDESGLRPQMPAETAYTNEFRLQDIPPAH